jgi:Cu+-exporting ATPase
MVLSFEVVEEGKNTLANCRATALQLVASLEVLSTHPLAVALCQYAKEEGASVLPAENTEYVAGCGMVGTVAGKRVAVGTVEFVMRHVGLADGQQILEIEGGPCKTSQSAYFAVEGLCRGCATFEDTLRPGTAAAVRRFRELGMEVSILSGDRSPHLAHVAAQVGVAAVQGGCLPHVKAERVKALVDACPPSSRIIMVGDEGNDAPALAAAHVGIAVGTQSGLASRSADVVVSSDGVVSPLARVVQLVLLCRVVLGTARRGVNCGLGLSAAQVCAAASGLLAPRTNAVLQELVDVSALANAASVLRHRWA